ERFNEGSLPQAVSTLELADRLTSEKKVDAGTVEIVRRRLGETLDGEQLRKFTEKPDQHALLRKVLQFFTAFRPDGLLQELRGGGGRGGAAGGSASRCSRSTERRRARPPTRTSRARRPGRSTTRSGSTGATSSTSCAAFRAAPRPRSRTRARSSCATHRSACRC